MNEVGTERLFARFREKGDGLALARVFDQTAPTLLQIAMHLAGSSGEAEDLLQATYVTAIERARAYDPARPLMPWLVGILAHHGKNAGRKAARARTSPDLEVREGAGILEDVVAREERGSVEAALADLKEPYREVLTQRLRHGRSGAEIALMLRRPPATIRTQLHRGLDLLRKSLPKGLLAGGALAGMHGRGLAAVRTQVLAHAAETTTVASGIAGVILAKKLLAAALLLAVTATLVATSSSWSHLLRRAVPEEGGTATAARQEGEQTAALNSASSSVRREASPELETSRAAQHLTPPARKPVTRVSGRVLEERSGRPVKAAAVWLGSGAHVEAAPPPGHAVTRDNGSFELSTDNWDFSTIHIWSDEHALLSYDIDFPARAEAEKSGINLGDLRLVPGVYIAGRVVTHDGMPAPDAVLLLQNGLSHPAPRLSHARPVGRTDSGGWFTLEHVPPSRFLKSNLFALTRLGSGCLESNIVNEQDSLPEVVIRLFPNAELVVTVADETGQPVRGAMVAAMPIRTPYVSQDWSKTGYEPDDCFPAHGPRTGEHRKRFALFETESDESGLARFGRLPAGFPCAVMARADGKVAGYLAAVTVMAGQTTRAAVELVPHRLQSIRGCVVNEMGLPVPRIAVRKYATYEGCWSRPESEVITDDRGRFEINDLEPLASFDLVVATNGVACRPHRVRVPRDHPLNNVELLARPARPIRGSVVDELEGPVAGAQIWLLDGERRIRSDRRETADDGRFCLSAASAGRWPLYVMLPGPREQWGKSYVMKLVVAGGDETVRIVATRNFQGRASLVAEIVDLATGLPLNPTYCRIGEYGPAGEAPPWYRGTARRSVGEARFDHLGPGRYRIDVDCDGYARCSENVTIAPADSLVRVRMEVGDR